MVGVSSRFHTTAPLPMRRSRRASPSSEPMASPSGLTWLVSRKRLPWRTLRSRSSGAFIPPILQALQKVGNPLAVLGPTVELEDELGGRARAEPVGQLGAQEPLGMPQTLDGLQPLFLGAERRHLDHRPSQILADLDRGHVDQPDARVVHVPEQQVVELGAHQIADTVVAVLHCAPSRICGSQRVKNASVWLSTRLWISSIRCSISPSRLVTAASEISARWCRSWKPVSAIDTRKRWWMRST